MRRSLKTGVAMAAVTLTIEALAVLPGRIAVGQHLGALGQSAAEITIAGVLRDVSDLARPIGFVIGMMIVMGLFLGLSRTAEAARRRAIRAYVIALAVTALLLWFTSAAAAEFKLQRGVDATWFDIEIASRATTPGDTLLGFLGLRRHFVPGVLGFVIVGGILFAVRKRARSWDMTNRPALVGGFAAMTLLGWGLALIPLDPNVRIFRTIGDRHIVGEPFVNMFGTGFGHSQENVRLGMRALIETATFPPERSTGGEAILGVPRAEQGPIDCTMHPFARSFPGAGGVEAPRRSTTGHHPLEPEAARVVELLDQLSEALYAERTRPIDVWQVMLESFRADDLHALEKTAPAELAPFMNGLYESAARGDGSVIAMTHMWQGGSRSSQGLSSYQCGLGTMPYGLSTTRDFGAIPLRCLTDVLSDAKFESSFWYGGNPSFDEMDPFFRHHGVTNIIGRQQFPREAPVGQEGVTDRFVYTRAANRILESATDRARYTLVMSASNHIPYGRPEDMPSEVEARANALIASPAFIGSKDDGARVRTFAYADHALAELVEHLKPRADRTIFVFGADHATGDPWAWSNPTRNLQAATARIPFTIVLPDPLIASSRDPEKIRGLVRDLDRAFDGHAWSQNDTPFFVLMLLSHAPDLQAIPSDRRWHTLGGERTSPYWKGLRPEAKVVGIDSMAELYGEDDQDHTLLPPEKASFVNKPSEITTSSPSLIPVAAAMQTYLRGYVAKCGSDKRSASRAGAESPNEKSDSTLTKLAE